MADEITTPKEKLDGLRQLRDLLLVSNVAAQQCGDHFHPAIVGITTVTVDETVGFPTMQEAIDEAEAQILHVLSDIDNKLASVSINVWGFNQ